MSGLEPRWGDGAPATSCTHRESQGARSLLNAMLRKWAGSTSFGIESCRDARGGSGLSLHAEGRALDWHPATKAQGDEAFALCVRNALGIGAQEIIWYSQIWTLARQGEGVRPYVPGPGGSPHEDHVHVGLVPGAAANMTAAQAVGLLDGDGGNGGFSVDVPGLPPIGTTPGAIGPQTITDPLDAIASVATFLRDPDTWRRVGLVVGGVILVLLGLLLLNRDLITNEDALNLLKGQTPT